MTGFGTEVCPANRQFVLKLHFSWGRNGYGRSSSLLLSSHFGAVSERCPVLLRLPCPSANQAQEVHRRRAFPPLRRGDSRFTALSSIPLQMGASSGPLVEKPKASTDLATQRLIGLSARLVGRAGLLYSHCCQEPLSRL